MAPVVSVIIRTYNRAVLLQKAILSVLNQTFQDFEIIVVNNYSTDNTIELVKSFNDERIRIINIRNKGIIAKSRNVGLKKSHGDYIAFLDDDDLWCPEKLEIQVEYLRKHLEYYLVYSNAWYIDENDVRDGLIYNPQSFKEGEVFEEFVRYCGISQLTVLMKREVFETVGFFNEDPAINPADDFEYWLRVALHYKIGFVKEPLAMYRVHSEAMSHEINYAKLEQNALSSVINDPLVPNKNTVVERIYELYLPSAIYNWKNSKSAAKEDIKKYLMWSVRNYKIKNIIKVIGLPYLFLKSRLL